MPIRVSHLRQATSLEHSDLNSLVQVIFHRDMYEEDGVDLETSDVEVRDGEVLTILLYDLMKQQGYTDKQLYPMLTFFNKELVEVSKSFVHGAGQHLPMVSLQTFDNRFAGLAGYGGMAPLKYYDMGESKPVTGKLPPPLVSGLIVIPELIGRARKCVANLARLHSEAADSPKS